MRSRPLFAVSLALVIAACAGKPKPAAVKAPPTAGGVKIGRPYEVFGNTYVPKDDRSYDARGIASWYGPTFHAKPTATGEIYNQDDLTAAHKTLPMPSWVEVTNLDNGRQLTVRINDRGPFVEGRIIDLSRRSAQLLGVDRAGLAKVRVRRVYPKGDWAMAAPPAPAAAPPIAIAADEGRYIQIAALSEESRARALASVLSDFGPAAATATGSGLWRVRVGPISPEKAEDLLMEIRAAGYPDARLTL
jgi:rare lipoprotein A